MRGSFPLRSPKSLQRVLHPLWNSSIPIRSGNLTDAAPGSLEAEAACLTFFPSFQLCPSHRLCGAASRPSRNTSLLGMPASSGGHRLWEPCQYGSPLCPPLFSLHSFLWDRLSLVVPKLAPSEGRLMRSEQFPHIEYDIPFPGDDSMTDSPRGPQLHDGFLA